MMLELSLNFAIGALGLAMLLCGWRLLRGPSALDRVLALDTLAINAVALVVLLGLRWKTGLLFEAALIMAIFGFVSTVALSRHAARHTVAD